MAEMNMDNAQLDEIIIDNADAVHQRQPGHWQFEFFGRVMIALTDEHHNRMRIISPVAEVSDLDAELVVACLSANFDRALDARYAISGDYIWSAFIHPLRQLEAEQVVDAMHQVASLSVTFGTTFSSGGLGFGVEADEG